MNKHLVWMLLASALLGVVGCSGGKEAGNGVKPGPETGTAGTGAETPPTCEKPQDPVAPAMEISPFVHHTAGDVALVLARPSRALSNPIVTGLIKEVEAADPSVKFEEQLQQIQDELQIDPKQIEYVVVSVSSKTLAAVAPQKRPEPNFEAPLEAPPTAPDAAAPPEVPGTEPPPADPNAEQTSSEESAATDDEEQTPPVEPTGEMEEELDPFAPPPAPSILIRLLTPIDGAAKMAEMEAKDKANLEKMRVQWKEVDEFNEKETEGFDKEALAEMNKERDDFRQSMLKASETHRSQHGGVTLYQKGESKDRLCQLNPQTILYAQEAVVKVAIDRKGAADTTSLSAQLQTLLDRDFAIAIDLAPVDAMSQSGQLELPFPVQLFAAPLLKCRYLSLAADINGGNLLQVNLVAADEAGAKQLHAMLNPLLTDGITKAKAAKEAPGQLPPEASPFLPLGEEILDGTKLTQTGDLLSLVVARPAGLENLPTLARPMLVEAAQRKAEVSKRNDLKQIGLGMYNFFDSYRVFPSNDQGGSSAVGLSWRVHLLPFVDEAPLYNEFHMDEPWDSEHNKALIPRMPIVYGTSTEGKSSIHVFVGEGTPFGGKPFGVQNVTDGTSNTILCVRAGKDTADIWTKPGGLTFDKENPIAALGMIGEMFDVLLFDASARSFPKTIDAVTLRNLIMHNDGNPVEIPK